MNYEVEQWGTVFGQESRTSTPEQLEKGGVRIRRSPFDYTVVGGDDDLKGKYTRLHSVLELMHQGAMYVGGINPKHVSRITQLGIAPSGFTLDAQIPLSKRTVTWADAVTAEAAGLLVNDILTRVIIADEELRPVLNAQLEKVKIACNEAGLSESSTLFQSISGLVGSMRVGLPKEVIRRIAEDLDIAPSTATPIEAKDLIVEALMEHAAYADTTYMMQSAVRGTQIHAVLEFVANYAIDNQTIEWPTQAVREHFATTPADLVEKAELTWDTTVATLGLTPDMLFDTELVILINHQGERVAGAVDLAYVQDDQLYILDWKTGTYVDKPEYQVQLVAYSMASALITRYGVFEVDNPEAKAVLDHGMIGDPALPNQPGASFQWGDRTITIGSHGILVRTAVDDNQDVRSQEAQCWQVNYDPQLREFCYLMLRQKMYMEAEEIDKRLKRGITRLQGPVQEATRPQQASRASVERAPAQPPQVSNAPTQAAVGADRVGADESNEPFGKTPEVATTVTPQPDIAPQPAQVKTPQGNNAPEQANATHGDNKQVVGSRELRLAQQWGTRFKWDDATVKAFAEEISKNRGTSVSAQAEAFNRNVQVRGGVKVG